MNPHTRRLDYCVTMQEEDGSPVNKQCKPIKVTNGTLTDNTSYYSLSTGGGGSGDSVTVNGSDVDTTANFADSSGWTWTLTDGGAGGPDDITVAAALTGLSDVGSATVTGGRLLVADGTDFESVAISGDITITSAGVTTIQDSSVQFDDTDFINTATATAGRLLVADGTDWESVDVLNIDITNSRVGVGTITPSGHFAIDGKSDEAQFIIKGHSTQNQKLMIAEQDDGTDVFTVENDGTVTAVSFVSTGSGESTVSFISVSNTLEIPNGADVSAKIGEGQISWDSDDDKLYVGNGATVTEIGSGSGATTDGGATTYVTSTTDNFAMGGAGASADVFFDNSNGNFIFSTALVTQSSTITPIDYCTDANAQGCWGMEDSGTESDLTSNSEDLTETSGTIPQSVDRKFGAYSRDFESGDTEYLTVADGGSTDISGADQDISICYWFKRESDSGSAEVIIGKRDDNEGQYVTGVSTGDVIFAFLYNDGTSAGQASGASAIGTGTWYHYCMVYNDTDIRLYLDGSLDSNGADNPKAHTSGIYDGSAAFAIGTWFISGSPTQYWDGMVDDVIILDRALSVAEVSNIYNYGMQGTGAGTATFASGDTTPDVSSNTQWNSNATTVTITDFDGVSIVSGQILVVTSKGATTYDVTSSGLIGGTTDIVTADTDVTMWIYDGTDWFLLSYTDMSDDLN